MNEVDRLITAFRNEDTPSLSDPDVDSHKDRIISKLEEYSSDPRVLAFLLEVAAETNEYDLARMEAFKVLYVMKQNNDDEMNQIGSVIARVLLNEDDDDVKNYAAIAAASYMAIPLVEEAVEKIVLDAQTNPNLRANAFEAIARSRKSPKLVRVLQALLQDGQFGQTARRVLHEWGVTP